MDDERTTLTDDEIVTQPTWSEPRAATADIDGDDADTGDDDTDDSDSDSDTFDAS